MSEDDPKATRLAQSGSALERGLLGSARTDVPGAARREAVMRAVERELQRSAPERPRRAILAWAGGVALGAAAAAVLLHGLRSGPVTVSAEPPAPATSSSVPAVSPSGAPTAHRAPAVEFVPCTPVARATGNQPLIDDFEDGDKRLPLYEHRAASWMAFNDETGKQRPSGGRELAPERIPGGRGASRYALHTSGGKFTKWGAMATVELSPRRCYDASAYSGVRFWARGKGRLRFAIKMTQVVAEEFGGSCTKDCFDAHQVELTLTRGWQEYTIRFDDLRQRGYGETLAFDARSLYSIEFLAPPEATPFDFWIDDVAFWKAD